MEVVDYEILFYECVAVLLMFVCALTISYCFFCLTQPEDFDKLPVLAIKFISDQLMVPDWYIFIVMCLHMYGFCAGVLFDFALKERQESPFMFVVFIAVTLFSVLCLSFWFTTTFTIFRSDLASLQYSYYFYVHIFLQFLYAISSFCCYLKIKKEHRPLNMYPEELRQ